MQNDVLVSIVALCYNQAQYVIETLDSIKNQTHKNIQLIIIDDCSQDASVQIIKDWIDENKVDCEFIQHSENWGLTKSCNDGLNRVKGKYYQVIACDDIMLKDKIERQVNILEKSNEDVAMVFSDAYLMQEDGSAHYGWFIQRHRNFAEIPSGNIYEELMISNFIPAMAFLAKTEAVKKLGGYDEELQYEDYDLWLRIAKDHLILFDDYPSVKYRIHGNNLHRNMDSWHEQWLHIFKQHIPYSSTAMKRYQQTFIQLYKSMGKIDRRYAKDLESIEEDKLLIFAVKNGISFTNYIRLKKVFNAKN